MMCKVCGRGPARYDSLCFGVHANCTDGLSVDPILFRVRDKRSGNVWYCTESGMRVIEDVPQWVEGLHENSEAGRQARNKQS
jgi:hypothetical protein